jgi:hypothetical protein
MPALRRVLLLLIVALTLGACAGDVNPVRDTFVDAGIGAKPRAAPAFIERTRPENLDYLPVGADAPARSTRAKTDEEVRRAEAEMEAVRTRQAARGGAAPRSAETPKP